MIKIKIIKLFFLVQLLLLLITLIILKREENISITLLKNLTLLLKKVFLDIKKEKTNKHKIILFSPAAASFDSFKNFEDRGKYFNNLIRKKINA